MFRMIFEQLVKVNFILSLKLKIFVDRVGESRIVVVSGKMERQGGDTCGLWDRFSGWHDSWRKFKFKKFKGLVLEFAEGRSTRALGIGVAYSYKFSF